ncbi:hypothetical protein DFH09DRAFT_1079441 [Mycena vulgaris]|nr:hypothetical protein DFH09DRAFT_1079441 [Mycena vulgaris]
MLMPAQTKRGPTPARFRDEGAETSQAAGGEVAGTGCGDKCKDRLRPKIRPEREKAESTLTDFGETPPLPRFSGKARAGSTVVDLCGRIPSSAGYRVRLYAVVHALRTTINSQRETARLERNAKQRAIRQKKKGTYVSELEDETDSEDEGEDEQFSTDEEEDAHPRSSPIPPSPKRQRRILEEVTNADNSTRPTTKRAARKPLQCAAELFVLGFVLGFILFFLHLGATQPCQKILELLRGRKQSRGHELIRGKG